MSELSIFDYYHNLCSYKEKQSFRTEVLTRCEIQYPTFARKLKDNSWTRLEREEIIRIIRENDAKGN